MPNVAVPGHLGNSLQVEMTFVKQRKLNSMINVFKVNPHLGEMMTSFRQDSFMKSAHAGASVYACSEVGEGKDSAQTVVENSYTNWHSKTNFIHRQRKSWVTLET